MKSFSREEKHFIARCRHKMRGSNGHGKRHKGNDWPKDKMTDNDLSALYNGGKCTCYRCGESVDLGVESGELQFSLDRLKNGKTPYTKNNVEISHLCCNHAERHWGRKEKWTKERYAEHFRNTEQNPKTQNMNTTTLIPVIFNGQGQLSLPLASYKALAFSLNGTNTRSDRISRIPHVAECIREHNLQPQLKTLRGSEIGKLLVADGIITKEEWNRHASSYHEVISRFKKNGMPAYKK